MTKKEVERFMGALDAYLYHREEAIAQRNHPSELLTARRKFKHVLRSITTPPAEPETGKEPIQ